MGDHRMSHQDGNAFADDMLCLFGGGAGQHSLPTVRFKPLSQRSCAAYSWYNCTSLVNVAAGLSCPSALPDAQPAAFFRQA